MAKPKTTWELGPRALGADQLSVLLSFHGGQRVIVCASRDSGPGCGRTETKGKKANFKIPQKALGPFPARCLYVVWSAGVGSVPCTEGQVL